MLIAAFDSTAVTASCAVAEITNGKVSTYSLFTVKNKLTHSEILLPLLENALLQYGASISDIDLFAVSAGPGSFTGVRIGVATVKGLAFNSGKPCASVSPIEAMAKTVGRGYVLPVMDARRDQYYTALFKDGSRVTEDDALSVDEIKEMLKDVSEITVCGDGRDGFLAKCNCDGRFFPCSDATRDQNALSVAICGYEQFEKGLAVSAESLQPIYLRMPQAERERLEREKANKE